MPNWGEPGEDCPSREDIYQMEKETMRREREWRNEQMRVESYLKDHPSSSWAEAEFYSRRKYK